MNKDQVKGALKEAAREAQELLGRLVGSKEQEAKGHAREMEGKAQKNYGNAKETIADAADEVADSVRRATR